MSKAYVDPAELRRFSSELTRFNNDLQGMLSGLHGKLRGLRIWQLAKYRIVARKGAERDRYAGTARGARRRRCGSKTGQRPGICMKNPAWEGWFHSRPAQAPKLGRCTYPAATVIFLSPATRAKAACPYITLNSLTQ